MVRKLLQLTARHWKLLGAFVVGVLATLFFIGVTHLSFNLTGTNEFCGKCHEMLRQVETWKMSSHSINAYGVVTDCVDCHLPVGGVYHYIYKAYSGLRDVVVHYLGDPNKVNWTAKRQYKNNYLFEDACRACHQDLIPPGMPRGGFWPTGNGRGGEPPRGAGTATTGWCITKHLLCSLVARHDVCV